MNEWNSNLYDGSHAFVSELGKGVLSLLHPRRSERIIDLGCGTGDLAVEIAAGGATVVGVDASEDMLRRARDKWSAAFPDIRFEKADILDLSRYSGFNAAFSNATLHWIKEAEQAAKQIAGVLKPGGRFVAEFGGYRNVEQIRDQIFSAAVQDYARSGNGNTADYVRLRVVATRL